MWLIKAEACTNIILVYSFYFQLLCLVQVRELCSQEVPQTQARNFIPLTKAQDTWTQDCPSVKGVGPTVSFSGFLCGFLCNRLDICCMLFFTISSTTSLQGLYEFKPVELVATHTASRRRMRTTSLITSRCTSCTCSSVSGIVSSSLPSPSLSITVYTRY